jgi:hypothetical protein
MRRIAYHPSLDVYDPYRQGLGAFDSLIRKDLPPLRTDLPYALGKFALKRYRQVLLWDFDYLASYS